MRWLGFMMMVYLHKEGGGGYENMYFLVVKSTAHPPIIGALGHSTHFIVKQPNTAMVNIHLH